MNKAKLSPEDYAIEIRYLEIPETEQKRLLNNITAILIENAIKIVKDLGTKNGSPIM